MAKLEELTAGAHVSGVSSDGLVEVIAVKWFGDSTIDLTYKIPETGLTGTRLLYRDDESGIEVLERSPQWSFDGDGYLFRLVSEARRIKLAYLFDPVLAVHTSDVEPLPHQITAVYESMLPRQPLRFLLADDPGAGKTIMAGLLIKELKIRGDVERCLVVCPRNLVEQWQYELSHRFQLHFEIMTSDKLNTSMGNWFSETPLAIAPLDTLARNEENQKLLKAREGGWDLIICDEAHKMSASFFGREIEPTKRYKLGQILSALTRHFLLLTATPHNGKDEDFQLFMALLDADRFEGKFRDGVHTPNVSDMMRRMVKEKLFKFDATPLFPKRVATSVPYELSDGEARLYAEVTDYVRKEFNRAESLENDNRKRNIGFALTILQRRLASSPEAIYQSLCRRRQKLETRLEKLRLSQSSQHPSILETDSGLKPDDIDDLEDAPDEMSDKDEEVLSLATAAQTAEELDAEIKSLRRLESLAQDVRASGTDRKWSELAGLLDKLLSDSPASAGEEYHPSPHQKLVVFTEHRDTLSYLHQKITTLLGRDDAVVVIHGGIKYNDRRDTQNSFLYDPKVNILLANDAASEGINLQRAHLMVNYDLPWNPNRIEQRFGRIHRIGQTEVCTLWNLIAIDTKEGDVYNTLLTKLEEARRALGGQVFDVLGRVQFRGKPLRKLLLEAILHGEDPDVQAQMTKTVSDAFDREHVQSLFEESALAHESMDTSKIRRIREDMERAEARKIQPHYIQSFFAESFGRLGGKLLEKEPQRYHISYVPAKIRERGRSLGLGRQVLQRYDRIAFDKALLRIADKPEADYICPGHPLLDATLDLILEQNRGLLRQGAILVDEKDVGDQPKVLVYLEHSIQDEGQTRSGIRRTVSQRMHYVEIRADSSAAGRGYAPYLDYRPLKDSEPTVKEILSRPECEWIENTLESRAVEFTVSDLAPEHLAEIKSQRQEYLTKTAAQVKDRLTKEILHWDSRAEELERSERAGKQNARLNSAKARSRANDLEARLKKRTGEIQRELQLSSLTPIVLGAVLVVPVGLLQKIAGTLPDPDKPAKDTQLIGEHARKIIMEIERSLGYEPTDRESDKVGYDIESRIPATGKLRFIEVKGRDQGASTITVTRNEILTSLNRPDDYILAIVLFDNGQYRVCYVRRPFGREPDFGVTSVNYNVAELLKHSEDPS